MCCRPTKPQPDGVLVKALARAWRWQKLLDKGVYGLRRLIEPDPAGEARHVRGGLQPPTIA